MKKIPLRGKHGKGKYAFVDDEFYEKLSKHRWFAVWKEDTQSFYAVRNRKKKEGGKGHQVYMAREILGLEYGDKCETDHVNHNTLDNRESNLRIVTHQQNQFNRKKTKGYWWDKAKEKYYAEIRLNGKGIFLGYFDTTEEAHNVYLQAKERYHRF